MDVTVEQMFYGRGPRGYAVLGSTPDGEPFRSVVESLCESIGAPAGGLSFPPFLISKPCRGHVVMVKVMRGDRDPGGRETVFFHALVGSARDLAAAQVDAFVLDRRGCFVDRLPARIEPLVIPADDPPAAGNPPRFKVDFPAVILSRAPENDLVRSLLGKGVLERTWATFAFHALQGFDLYALDDRAMRPTGVACYDSAGERLDVPPTRGVEPRAPVPTSPETAAGRRGLLGISLAANALLLVGCGVLLFGGLPCGNGSADALRQRRENERLAAENAQMKKELDRLREGAAQGGPASGKMVSRADVMRELRRVFEEKYRGRRQEVMKNDFSAKDRDAFNPYIRFVNEAILGPGKGM